LRKVFLVSSLGGNEIINGVRYSTKMDDSNGIPAQLKHMLQKKEKMLFFASNSNMPEITDSYGNLTFESFQKSGIGFDELVIVDGRFGGNLEDEIRSADLIFLAGGHTETQMKYFEKIGLRDFLRSYNGVIIGQSAGALNLAYEVVCSPEYEEEILENHYWQGLELSRINIEPHFVLNVHEDLDLQLREELLKMSFKHTLYAICDGSHVFDDGESVKIYGEAYILKNGEIIKINENGMVFEFF
jgi:Peptidase E